MTAAGLDCCPAPEPKHARDLGHLYQFDFDLYRCAQCGRHCVKAWRMNISGWHPVSEQDAQTMLTTDESELRPFMKKWASDFN